MRQPSSPRRWVWCPRPASARAAEGAFNADLGISRFDRAGNELERFGVPVAALAPFANPCAPIVFTGTNFVTLWASSNTVYCARITEDGSVLDPGGASTGLAAEALDGAAYDGNHLLVTTTDGRAALVNPDCSAAGSFVALADGRIVGYSGLMAHDNDGVVEDGLTVVRRDWRRRGLAKALKQRELAWATAAGFAEVVTWTQNGNESMRTVNERLGYEYRDVAITMSATLPLETGTAL